MQLPGPGSKHRRQSGSLREIFRFAATWVVFFGVYLLLTQDCSTPELVAGGGAAALATVLLGGLQLIHRQPFRLRVSWLARLLRQLPPAVLRDCVRLIRFLGSYLASEQRERLATGQIVSRPFNPDQEERPGEARARQVLVILGICLPPNTFAIACECPPDRLLVHELVPSGEARGHRDPKWPL